MTIKRQLKKLTENLTGAHVYRHVPRGIDVFEDIDYHLVGHSFDVVFDIGANVGQSAVEFREHFPNATLYCFEPVQDTYLQMQAAVRRYDRVKTFQLAFGAKQGVGSMVHQESDQAAFLAEASTGRATDTDSDVEEVKIDTVDNFCAHQDVPRINYLKIDTEGGDLEVLKGAEGMLGSRRIDIVQVEAGMNPTNKTHVPFEALKEFLDSKSYFLFGIYEQMYEWPTSEPHLRRSNPVFVSKDIIEKYRGGPNHTG